MHAIDCPRCGDPLTESGEYCARCDKSIPSSETIDRHVEEKPVAEEIPETPISTAQQPVEEEESIAEEIPETPISAIPQPVKEEEKPVTEEIPETPVSVPQDETLQSPSEIEATSTLLITPENTADVPADLDETMPMPEGLSRKIRAVAPPADMAETMPMPEGLSREKSAVTPPADPDETMPMPQGLSRKIRAVAPSADMAETVPMPQGLSRETGAVALLVETAETVPMPQGLSREMGADVEFAETIPMPHELSRQARPLAPSAVEFTETVPLSYSTGEGGRTISRSLDVPTLNLRSMRGNARAGLEQDLQESLGEAAQEDVDEEAVTLHDNWQKVVEHKNSSVLPAMPVVAPEQKPGKAGWFPVLLGRRSPRSLAWLGVLGAIALLLSGAFGVAVSLGRTAQKVAPSSPILQALPATIALGGIVTLRGTYFPAGADLTLIRDGHIPLVDTSGASTIRTDAHGFFSDTFVVDPAWHPGTHLLSATDARTHQQASLPLLVTGKDALQGPPHLLLSSASLDLGSGDRFTTTSQQLALSNAGGGQATWQATTSQPWLQITPASGSIESGKHISVVVAADRSQLAPGSYQASIVFISNSGQAMLAVNLDVTDLQPGHQAILQISPAALAFRAAVHGPTPARQTVTISNPGIQPLIWGASVNGSGWLTAAPLGGTIPPGGQQQVTVSATPGALGSGVYQGSLSFFNQGSQPVQGSPQSVSVSLTMTPACTLAFGPASLAFTGAQGGLAPAGQALTIGVANGCANQAWKATAATTTGGNWLTVSAAAGTTPSAVTVSTITTGLPAGTYKGTLSFTSGFGTQLLAVTLTVTASTCSVSGAPAVLALQGTANQAQPIAQNVALSATAGCLHALTWTSSASAAWLSATPSGTLAAATPAAVTITAHLAALPAGPYQGTVTIAVVDSVTKLTVGTVTIAVTLNVQIQSTPIVQPSPTPTATAPPTPIPTAAPTPTATAPPSPTPTATPKPTPTPTATALPSPTATPKPIPTV